MGLAKPEVGQPIPWCRVKKRVSIQVFEAASRTEGGSGGYSQVGLTLNVLKELTAVSAEEC